VRTTLFLTLCLGMPCVSLAQTAQGSWAKLSTLQPGQNIQVVETTSKKHSGAFVSVSDAAISYRGNAGEHSISKQDVRSVKLMQNTHRLRNTLLVGAAGAGVGAAIGAATHHGCSTQSFCIDVGGRALPSGIGAVIGGLGGAVVGVVLPSHSTIYNVSSP
jgi:hypothetical protein